MQNDNAFLSTILYRYRNGKYTPKIIFRKYQSNKNYNENIIISQFSDPEPVYSQNKRQHFGT